MFKKLAAAAALACAALAVVAPAASAATQVFAGVYPNHAAASRACAEGAAQGRWSPYCEYIPYPDGKQVGLLVMV
jgi:hypothetical protein